MGSLAHPTKTKNFLFVSGGASFQQRVNDSRITILGECKENPTRHYVACDNVSWPI